MIPVFVIVGKRAGLENFPESIAAQLDFRAEPDVAGEQAEHRRIRQREQITDEFTHAFAHVAVAVNENVVEPEDVAPEKLPEMFGCFRQSVDFEKFADQAHIGAPGKLHLFRTMMKVEFGRERFGERLCSGVSGMNERAVNIEENEPNHARRS
jgi:hypothetical protein